MSVERSCSEDFDLRRGYSESKGLVQVRSVKDSPDWNDAVQEFYHFDGVTALTVKEVKAIPHFFDRNCVLLCVVLENELLEV